MFRGLVVVALATLFYVFSFTLRIMPSAMTHQIMSTLHIEAQLLGILVGMMYTGYTLMQIPVGLLFDRFSSRKILTLAAFFCSTGSVLLGATNHYWVSLLGSLIMGMSEAFGFVGVLVLSARWFPAKYFALIVGIVQMMGAIGAILGEGPIALLVTHHGWHQTVLSMATFGYVVTLMVWLFVRDKTSNHTNHSHSSANRLTEWQRLKLVSHNSQTWWLALYSFCIWAPVLILAGLWLVPFLMVLYQTSNTVAASASSWVWVGIGLGSPLFGWWSNLIGRRCMPLAVSAVLSLVGSLIIIYGGTLSWPLMCLVLFIFGLGASGQALSFGVVQDNNAPHVAGTAVGINNMAVVFGGVLLQPLIGILLHLQWGGSVYNGVPVYTVSDYQHALIVAPLCGLIALVISLFLLKETHCQPIHEQRP
ncbi:MAG: MFS transporter [Coxiellaceae bacterium]|nr:MAG: MFS transporter [Coxiellaceae bacterium]